MRKFCLVLLLAGSFVSTSSFADHLSEEAGFEEALTVFTERLGNELNRMKINEAFGQRLLGPDVIKSSDEDGFGGDPEDEDDADSGDDSDYESSSDYDLPLLSRRSGAAERVAMITLYETLMYYGVVHVIETKGKSKRFRVIQSKSGHFKELTSLDIAFSIREFSRYIVALMCNDPSQENFSKLISQTTEGEIGLRFKFDMAWVLLGNYLPKQPHDIYRMGTRWNALLNILKTTKYFNTSEGKNDGEASVNGSGVNLGELRSWAISISDVINIIGRLNQLMCFVDIRPNPREEIKKRKGVNFLLSADNWLRNNYGDLKDLVDQVVEEGKKSQIKALQTEPI